MKLYKLTSFAIDRFVGTNEHTNLKSERTYHEQTMNVNVLHVLTNYNTTPEQIHGWFFNMGFELVRLGRGTAMTSLL